MTDASVSPLSVPDPWNDVAPGYEKVTREFMTQFSEEAAERLGLGPDSSLLDVACGPGTSSLVLAPRLARVQALDFAEDMLAMDPTLPEPEADLESWQNPDVIRRELEAAGFSDVQVEAIEKPLAVPSAQQFWDDMVQGAVPIRMMKHSMTAKEWNEKQPLAIARLEKVLAERTQLTSTALLGSGTRN